MESAKSSLSKVKINESEDDDDDKEPGRLGPKPDWAKGGPSLLPPGMVLMDPSFVTDYEIKKKYIMKLH